MDPPCSYLLQRIMANVSELDGQLYSRNLKHVGVDILKISWIKNIQIQQEAKSTITPFSAGSKVVYMMEDESRSVVAEATPDFYAKKVSLDHIYHHWGDRERGLPAP